MKMIQKIGANWEGIFRFTCVIFSLLMCYFDIFLAGATRSIIIKLVVVLGIILDWIIIWLWIIGVEETKQWVNYFINTINRSK